MNQKIKDIIESEARELGITSSKFRQYVDSGIRLILGSRPYMKLEKLMKTASQYDMLQELILVCAYGGMIESKLDEK